MSDYDPRDIRIDTSFSRPVSSTRDFLGAESLPRYSRASHASRARDVTWISASQPSQYPATQTPQTPQPRWQSTPVRPTPALHTTPPTLSDSDEYMTVDIESNAEEEKYVFNEGHERKLHGRKKFYGGFMSGLKSIPRVMSRGRLNSKDQPKPVRQAIPSYQQNPQSGPSFPQRQLLPNDVPQVERLDTPPSIIPSPTNHNILLEVDPRTSIADTRRDRTLSAVNESYEPTHSRSHDDLFRPHSRSHRREISNTSHPFHHSTEAISIPHTFHPSPQATATPILVEPQPAADFAKMESPIRPPPEESIASQMARIRRGLRELKGLPWVSPARISNEYIPGQGERRRYSCQRPAKTSKSWYSERNKGTLDLLQSPSTGRIQQHVRNSQPAPAPAPYVMSASSANLMFSGQLPGGRSRSPSSDGAPSSDSASNAPYSGPLYPAYVAQPLFVYPSGLPSPGSGLEAQPRPVFFTSPVVPPYATSERSRSPLRHPPGTPVMG
ncbi:hypothetical protein K503DRAFT_775892 [Rhizopogon vinicolor AM-OR11-026]|uniref:Uncharacterized protein n=1 Tax=Rhizopogon vinicolor AM-OR11-026 TaxID=1314800 RepID=A0A1B7MKP1_9AGAM|nr:hypothetical protein K503DRAFT_775892 [Rhizopogon vinicolor AM-OR11-026]